jgi:Uma2 family endonuclease
MSQSHPSKLTLSHQDDGLELSHEEFAEADFAEPWRYERVNGRLVVMTPSGFEHNAAGQPFRHHLGAYELAHPDIVEFVLPEAWVVVDENTDRIADIAVYLRSPEPQPASAERVPDLIFEIVSPTAADRRRDYEEKRAEYQRIGVWEYVIVDRFEHRVLVLRLQNGQYAETELGPNDSYTTALLPGLEIPLEKILSN